MRTTLLPALAILCTAPLLPAQIGQIGVEIKNGSLQTDEATTVRFGSVLNAYIEGNNLTSTSPISSASFSGPGISESMFFDEDSWRYEDARLGLAEGATVRFSQGNYTINAGVNSTSVNLTGSHPVVPRILTTSGGTWQGGELLTAEEAGLPLTMTTNASDGNGFITFRLGFVENYDPETAYLDGGERVPSSLSTGSSGSTVSIDSNTMMPGGYYVGELEYDDVLDSKPATGTGGTAFALASSTTLFTIRVQNVVLDADVVWTGPKAGRFEFPTETGFNYTLKRSTDLTFGTGGVQSTIPGNGSLGTLPFDDSAGTDGKAFFRVEREAVSTAPAQLNSIIGGKTYRGFSYTANNRWSAFGLAGNWTYATTGAQTGDLVLTFDDLNNDPQRERDVYSLDFGSDGDLSTIGVSQSSFFNDALDDTSTYDLDLSSNSFAPPSGLLEELLVGQTYLGYTFISSTRFTFAGSEPGNWSFTYPDDDTVTLTFTYDEDLNNPTTFREEVDLNFNGTKDVPFQYRQFDGNSQTGTNSGTVELLLD